MAESDALLGMMAITAQAKNLGERGLHARLSMTPGGTEWFAKVMQIDKQGRVVVYGDDHNENALYALVNAGHLAITQVEAQTEKSDD